MASPQFEENKQINKHVPVGTHSFASVPNATEHAVPAMHRARPPRSLHYTQISCKQAGGGRVEGAAGGENETISKKVSPLSPLLFQSPLPHLS